MTTRRPTVRNGIPLLPPRPGSRPVTMEQVNRLRDEVEESDATTIQYPEESSPPPGHPPAPDDVP